MSRESAPLGSVAPIVSGMGKVTRGAEHKVSSFAPHVNDSCCNHSAVPRNSRDIGSLSAMNDSGAGRACFSRGLDIQPSFDMESLFVATHLRSQTEGILRLSTRIERAGLNY
jgi:hypothetical protein